MVLSASGRTGAFITALFTISLLKKRARNGRALMNDQNGLPLLSRKLSSVLRKPSRLVSRRGAPPAGGVETTATSISPNKVLRTLPATLKTGAGLHV